MYRQSWIGANRFAVRPSITQDHRDIGVWVIWEVLDLTALPANPRKLCQALLRWLLL